MKNSVSLIGRIGKIESKQGNNMKIVKASLATTKKYKDKEETTWHNIVFFDKVAEIAEKYVTKGDIVSVDGEIKYNKYESKGETKYFTEITINKLLLFPKVKTESRKDIQEVDVEEVDNDGLPF